MNTGIKHFSIASDEASECPRNKQWGRIHTLLLTSLLLQLQVSMSSFIRYRFTEYPPRVPQNASLKRSNLKGIIENAEDHSNSVNFTTTEDRKEAQTFHKETILLYKHKAKLRTF